MRVTNLSRIAIGVGGTTAIEVVRDHVAVFVQAITTFGDVIIAGAAIFVGAVEFAVAIVIEPIRACARTEFRLSGLTQVTRRAIAKGQTIGIGAIDIPIAIIVFAVITYFHRIWFDEHIEGKQSFIGSLIRINGVSIEENVIRSGIQKRKVQLGGPLNAAAVVIASDFFARITLARTHVKNRIE
jgi:hypothetical protein